MRLWPAIFCVIVCACPGLVQEGFAQKKRAAKSPAAAASSPGAAPVFALETLHIDGNTRIPAEKILAVSGLKIGSPVTKEDFDAARAKLLATGAFESVACEFKPSAARTGYDGSLEVVEIDQIFPYRFEDLPIPDDVLRDALRKQEPLLGDKIPVTAQVIGRYAKAIEALADAQQAGAIEVAGRPNYDVPGQLTIVFRPSSPRLNIAEVNFAGNEVLPSGLLINTLSGVAIGVPYSEVAMRLLLDSSIRPLYDARGRIRVAFPQIVAEKSKKPDVDGVVVTVTVNEGPSFNLGNVRFAGVAAADTKELQRTANFQTDDIVNFDEIKAGVERIYHRYRNLGYLHVSGHVDREVHDQEHKVDVVVTLDPGPQFMMGKLEITGLDITTEPAIRKSWGLKSGAPFQPEYPDSFLKDIRDQGVFDNLGKTRAETKIDDKTNTVDVTLYFSGGAPPDASKRREGRGGAGPR
jgi:outer membrane protein insertion porin family